MPEKLPLGVDLIEPTSPTRDRAIRCIASIAALTGHVYGMPELVHEVREGRVASRIGKVKSERNLPLRRSKSTNEKVWMKQISRVITVVSRLSYKAAMRSEVALMVSLPTPWIMDAVTRNAEPGHKQCGYG